MFRYIKFDGYRTVTLCDSSFGTINADMFNVIMRGISLQRMLLVATLQEYIKRNLPVALNVSLMYIDSQAVHIPRLSNIVGDADFIDTNYPEICYGKKYFPCVKRHLVKHAFVHNWTMDLL